MEKYYCTICGKYLGDDYDPMMCCSGRDCACMGLSTNIPVCSKKCYNKFTKKEEI